MALISGFEYWIASLFYVVAGVYLLNLINKNKLHILNPLAVYLGSIAVFFMFMGISMNFKNDLVYLIASLALIFGGASITRFPLRLQWKKFEIKVYTILLILGGTLIFSLYFLKYGIPLIMRVAHGFAFLTAGVFTIGYFLILGMRSKNKVSKTKSVSIATALGLCCVVAHGLILFQLFVTIVFPFFGGLFNVGLPLFFALLSAVSLVFVLYIGRNIKNKNIQIKLNKDYNKKNQDDISKVDAYLRKQNKDKKITNKKSKNKRQKAISKK